MKRVVSIAVVVIVASWAIGAWLAAAPYGANELCDGFATEEGGGARADLTWWPAGTICHVESASGALRDVVHRPSVAASIAWIVILAVLLTVAIVQRTVVLRGIVIALTALAFAGFGFHFAGEFSGAGLFGLFFGIPAGVAVDWLLRRPGERPRSHSVFAGVLLVPAVLFVCAFVYLAGYGQAATAAGAVTGGLGLVCLCRAQPRLWAWAAAP